MANRRYSDVNPEYEGGKSMNGKGKGNDDGRLGGDPGNGKGKAKANFKNTPAPSADAVPSLGHQTGAEE